MNSSYQRTVPLNSLAVQQRLQISELQFDKLPTPSSLIVLEDKIQNRGEFLFRFSLESYVVDSKKWLWSIWWVRWNPGDQLEGKDFPNFEMLDARDSFCFE